MGPESNSLPSHRPGNWRVNLEDVTGLAVSLFSRKKRRMTASDPVEAKSISVRPAFPVYPAEPDSQAGRRAGCIQEGAQVYPDKPRSGADVRAGGPFGEPE